MEIPDALNVHLNRYHVGVLTRLPGNLVTFYFTQAYLDDPGRPTLSWGLFDAYKRLRAHQPPSTLGRVPPFFANLLPEGDLRKYIAHRGGISKIDDFALLWITGDDLPGAVTLHDPLDRALPPPTAGGPDYEVPQNEMLRFSLAGVQLKFSAIENAYGGLTIPVQGRDGQWIAKLPSRHLERVPENEFAMLQFAAAVGIDVPEIKLLDVADIKNLPEEARGIEGLAMATRRFDRRANGERIHIEDFNQIYRQEPREKYDNRSFANIAETVYQALGNDGLIAFIHRLVFNIAIANNDMHLKNWSFIYRDGRTPTLAPAYDYICTKVYVNTSETGLAIGRARNFQGITMEQMRFMAQRARVSSGVVEEAAREMIARVRAVWKNTRDRLPFEAMRDTIEDQLERVPLFNPATTPIPVPDVPPRKRTEIS